MGNTYMTAAALCAAARAMVGKYTYEQVDCIRVITNPLAEAGAKFPYIGSNWFARNDVSGLRRLTSRDLLHDGCAVFRSRDPGESGYDLPNRYKQGGSAYNAALGETDFHHIGLYVGGGEIVDSNKDSKRDGPAISTNWHAWEWVADIIKIDYGAVDSAQEGGNTMNTGIVNTGGNGAVNFRLGAGGHFDFVARNPQIPEGKTVTVISKFGDWAKIQYNGETGWVMSKYLVSTETFPENQDTTTSSGDTISISRPVAEALYQALGNALGK